MKQNSEVTVAETAYGKKLDTPIKYVIEWTTYESHDELVAAKDELTADEQVKVRNNERKGKARNAAYVAALEAAGIKKPTLDTDEQLRLREMLKVLMSSKRYTEDEAKALAATTLDLTWAE